MRGPGLQLDASAPGGRIRSIAPARQGGKTAGNPKTRPEPLQAIERGV